MVDDFLQDDSQDLAERLDYALPPDSEWIDPDSLPDCFEVSSWTQEGEIMGLRHREYSVEGVQFHPESILTEQGPRILKHLLKRRSEQ